MAAAATFDTPDGSDNHVRVRPTKAAMVVVGGSIVVAGAALTVLGIEGRFTRSSSVKEDDQIIANAVSMLPLLPTPSPVLRPFNTSWMTNSVPASSSGISAGRPSLRATRAPSTVGETEFPTYTTTTYLPTTDFPTYTTDFPTTTDRYTTPGESSGRTTSSLASNLFITRRSPTQTSSTSSDAFHLRLYWEQGYFWQEKTYETWWCMACASCNPNIFKEHCDLEDYCQENMMLAIMNCAPNQRKPKAKKGGQGSKESAKLATFTILKNGSSGLFGGGGDRIQVFNSNLCLQRMGARDIVLKRCDSSEKDQLFDGLRSDNQVMELIPFPGKLMIDGVETERCLAQHHHPRAGERIYAENCAKARNADHHWWVKY
jgi:hypothetical protein